MRHLTSLSLTATLLLAGCATDPRCCARSTPCDPCAPTSETSAIGTAAVPMPVPTAPARPFAFYDGKDGAPTSLEAFLDAEKDADVVAFGELHGHPIGAEMELATLKGLARGSRPVAIALEFFERDVQDAIDDYLAGRTTEAEFLKVARQGPAYPATHRPLVEFAKANHVAVLAANAPRRLVTDYRKGEKPYADFLSDQTTVDRGFLPATTTVATGPYLERFTKLMGGERGSKLIKAQSLWDDSMADTIATYRGAHPDARVMLVVGAFHVAAKLGTITKLADRRPNDRVALLVMSQGAPPGLAFDPDDQGEGDVILTVAPAPAPTRPAPAPAAAPAPVKDAAPRT